MRIVLDTNSLIIALSSKNKYGVVWKAFLEGRYTLCVSNEILEEYVEVIGRNLSPTLADMVAYAILLRKNVERIDPHFRFGLITADADVCGLCYHCRCKIYRNGRSSLQCP